MSLVTEAVRAKAEICHGHEKCQEKIRSLLKETGMPNGLLPVPDIEEVGHARETGFFWIKQKKKSSHKNEKIGKVAYYDLEVTGYVEKHKIKKITGVKSKELLIWINTSEIYLNDPPNGKITLKTPTGFSKSFPVSAFEIEEVKDTKQVSDATTTSKEV